MNPRLPQEHYVSKLLSMTGKVVDSNQAYKRVIGTTEQAQAIAYGKLNKSIQDLQETAEHVAKGGQS